MLLLSFLVITFSLLQWCQSKLHSLQKYKAVFVMQI